MIISREREKCISLIDVNINGNGNRNRGKIARRGISLQIETLIR